MEIVRKVIERLDKQILHYKRVQVSREQIDIAFINKFNTTDIPDVNSANGNIQRALQKYVGFSGMDALNCDRV